jgi:hypothetical protein
VSDVIWLLPVEVLLTFLAIPKVTGSTP